MSSESEPRTTRDGARSERFDPARVRAFRFVDYAWDEARATARFRYALEPGPEFVEEIHFPGARRSLGPREREALDRCLRLLFLVAGVSYYKAAAPPQIRVEPFGLSAETAAFLTELYREGLGEMAYENRLDLGGLRFEASPGVEPEAVDLALPRRTAVALGGGKDSIVALELLARSQEPLLLISIGSHAAVDDVVRVATRRHPGLEHVRVERRISPALLELNDRGALNGHIPISAVFAFLLATAGVVHGFDAVAVGNERSANVGSLVDGREVNHQWSKSYRAEQAMAALLRNEAVTGLRYFSALRPLSELAIARAFAGMTDYHEAFLSCNAGFRLRGASSSWCGECPKCRFVFLALAPFLEKERLLAIFDGRNLLGDVAQCDGFRALAGFGAPKPFECVGEIVESVAALELLARDPAWQGDAVVRTLAPELTRATAQRRAEIDAWREPASEHAIPARMAGPVLEAV